MNITSYDDFVIKCRCHYDRLGITQKELAARFQKEQSQVSKILSGKIMLSFDDMIYFADCLEFNILHE